MVLALDPATRLDLAGFRATLAPGVTLAPTLAMTALIAAEDAAVRQIAAGSAPVYGLNTALGAKLGERIAPDAVGTFQERLIAGRAVAVGPPLPETTGRAVLLARLLSAARGHSGMSLALHAYLVAAFNAGLSPVIPAFGSIGAGDLAQLSAWASALLGTGTILVGGRPLPAAAALAGASIAPPTLGPRDGMALVNHGGLTVALSAEALAAAGTVVAAARAVAALSCEAYGANRAVFAPEVNGVRPAPGQAEAARWFAAALTDAEDAPRRIQEALSFRTLAPVTGAAAEAHARAVAIWQDEANGVSDSPILTAAGDMRSTANFANPALALALEGVGLAAAMLANGAAMRIAKLMDPTFSALPRALSPEGGPAAGMVPLQKTAMALLAEIRQAAQPVAFDAPPVSEAVEDMAPNTPAAARKLLRLAEAMRLLVACEAVVAAQALDLRAPARRSAHARALMAAIRTVAAPLLADRPLGPDVEAVAACLADPPFVTAGPDQGGP